MKKVLDKCGTVVFLDMRKDNDFADIKVDMAGPEMRRLLEAFFESLPPSLQAKHQKAYDSMASVIHARYGKFELDIKPVMNKKVLREANDLIE